MFALSRTKKPLSGLGQRIAAGALLVLALIAAVALLSRGSADSDGSSSSGSSQFTPQSYSSGSSSGSASSRSTSATNSPADDDGTATVVLSDLPAQARRTVALIDAGGPYPYSRDGVVFANRERLLPRQVKGWYHEYTVRTPGSSDRGARRIITGRDGAMYYTDDHYETCRRIVR